MNPKLNLQGLAGSCFHVGSVRTLKVARVQDIISLPDCCGQSLPLDEKPVANRAGAFESYEFRADQLYLTEVPSKSGSGTSYSYEMVGSHPAIGNLEREEIGRMRDGHYICIATLWHGDILLLGSLEQPMLFEGSLNSGRSRTEGNSSAWRFTGLSPYPACMLGTDIVLVADPCSLQSVDDFVLSEWNIDYGSNAELLSIPMALSPAGTIQSVTAWNDGVVYDPNGTPVDTMQWNAGQSRYEPVAGPNYLAEGVHSFEVTLNTLLKSGETCSFTFSQTFTIIGINQPPQITSGSLTGIPQVGETLTMAYSYYDVNADPEDTTAVNRIMLRRYDSAAAANADTTGASGTLVANDVLTYDLVSADQGKFLRAFFTPHATSGATPGSTFATSVIGAVISDQPTAQLQTTNAGLITINLGFMAAERIGIDWGDGSALQFIDAVTATTGYQHTYSASGTKDIIIYCTPTNLKDIRGNTQQLTGTFNVALATSLERIYANGNTITTIQSNSSSMLVYQATGNQINHAIDISGMPSLSLFYVNNNNIPSVTIGANSGLTIAYLQNNPLTGTPNFSQCSALTSLILENTNITGISFNTTPGYHSALFSIFIRNNSLLASGINLAGCPALDRFIISNATGLGAVTFGTIEALTYILMSNCNQSGTFPLAQFPNMATCIIDNNGFTDVSVATHNALITFNANTNSIEEAELDGIINAFWAFRAGSASTSKVFNISDNIGNLSISNQSKDQLDGTDLTGTGTYLDDGLVDNGWNVTY